MISDGAFNADLHPGKLGGSIDQFRLEVAAFRRDSIY
jgi:hypothetical protein